MVAQRFLQKMSFIEIIFQTTQHPNRFISNFNYSFIMNFSSGICEIFGNVVGFLFIEKIHVKLTNKIRKKSVDKK